MQARWSMLAALLLAGCAAVPEDEVAATESAIAGSGCPMTPYVEPPLERWYCRYPNPDGSFGEEYLRFDGNPFPQHGAGPFSGSFTQWYPAIAKKVLTFNMSVGAYANGCQTDATGYTTWNLTTGSGISCAVTIYINGNPQPRRMVWDCSNGAFLACWEHVGPRAFGGLN